jgi:L-rhamnose mutarotase
MERVGFLLRVKADRLHEYKNRHLEIWPEMLAALQQAGWRNYSLFLNKEGLVFGYVEADNFRQALERIEETEISKRWGDEMAPFFEGMDGGRPHQRMELLERFFYLQ